MKNLKVSLLLAGLSCLSLVTADEYGNGYYDGGYNNPGYNNPGYNNPGYNNPGYNNPGYNNPGYNNPGYNNPGYNNPGYNNPGYNNPGYNNPEKVLLGDLKAFTVYKGLKTTGHRSPGVDQLVCVEGDACRHFQPYSMQCTQVGFDGHNASWECKATLEDYYTLGYTKVSCEGYDFPDDIYITRGSCAVRYSLLLTEKGKQHFGSGSGSNGNGQDGGVGWFAIFICGILICIFMLSEKKKKPKPSENDAPPPYGSWNPDYNPNAASSSNNNSSGRKFSDRVGDIATGIVAGHVAKKAYDSYRSRRRSRSRSRSRERYSKRSPSPPSPPQTYSATGYGDTERR